eukprot:10456172-Heterocapsa_arctica.AAC.1
MQEPSRKTVPWKASAGGSWSLDQYTTDSSVAGPGWPSAGWGSSMHAHSAPSLACSISSGEKWLTLMP